MKKGTRIASLFLAMIMVMASMSLLAFARAERCPQCNQGTLLVSTTYSTWVSTGEQRPCTTHPYGTDLQLMRTKTVTYECNYCSYGEIETSTQYMWECHGYE
ncbi:MAG: hypothetical protein VB086_10970 [Clostridiaceae bacterium]|nr:hypothetical protein [Clostridiaceae bacterium]